MNTAAHPVAPEDLMALLDGELSGRLAEAVSAHLSQCEECATLAGQLRDTSQSLSRWTVPAIQPEMEDTIKEAAADAAYRNRMAGGDTLSRLFGSNWKPVAFAAGIAAIGFLVVAITPLFRGYSHYSRLRAYDGPPLAVQKSSKAVNDGLALMDRSPLPAEVNALRAIGPLPELAQSADSQVASPHAAPTAASASLIFAPMIARTVNLTILVKDFTASRTTLDQILARHHGYFARLEVNTEQEGSRNLSGSLRVPAPDLSATLTEIRGIGRVLGESQSGEEVTQQHQDLVARLETARETEARFRAILQQRTGSLADVLSVEESIARIRGDIERMEAEQKTLEHRVDFASVEVQVREDYKAPLDLPNNNSISTRLRNAFVAGFHHAAETVLGIVLFLEEYGPAIFIWLALLALSVIAWRRYRRLRSRL